MSARHLLSAAVIGLLVAGCASTRPTDDADLPSASAIPVGGPTGPTESAQVTQVVDGDTIKVDIDGEGFTVRYIGVDTPETVHPSKPVQPFGPEASTANHELVEGQEVILERDVSETDRYGRLLRYVWLPPTDQRGWLFVNAELLRLGLAQIVTYPPDVKYADTVYLAAQREARDAGRGLWGDVAPSALETAEAQATPAPSEAPEASQPGTGGNCDPAYPGVCIPPAPPDLNCGDVADRRFEVLPPDPHGFDNDGDGVGCES